MRRCLIGIVGLLLAACSSPQNALAPRGPAAAEIERLWWVLLTIASIVSIVVTILLLVALRQAAKRGKGEVAGEVNAGRLVLVGGVAAPVVILIGVLSYNYLVGVEVYPSLRDEPEGDPLRIEVVGHQFWWEVRYPQYGFTTANEIRIPAGRPVRFILSAPDVIHSFWVPQLHGKMDMIPGRIHTLDVVADVPGLFRGQCAEFCGASHALMAFWVEAIEADAFEGWALERTASGAALAAEAEVGREVFMAAGCGECHATRGAPLPESFGAPAPDLSDLGARRTIAAGTLPNTRAALERWIRDPQFVKPGSHMPATELVEQEMDALLTYLESLR